MNSSETDVATAPEAEAAARPHRSGADRLFLRQMPFYAHHGVHEEERSLGQKFVVDVDWWLDTRPAAWADDIGLTISYQHVYDHVRAVVEDTPVHLVETLAERIATSLLDHFASVDQVRVVVHKPGAPITGVFGDLGIEIIRSR